MSTDWSQTFRLVASLVILSACGDSSDVDAETTPRSATATTAPLASDPSDQEMARIMEGAVSSDLPLEMRVFTVQQLGTLPPEAALGPLVKALSDPEPEVLLAAIEVLPETSDQAALSALRELGSHPDARVKAAAQRKLASLE